MEIKSMFTRLFTFMLSLGFFIGLPVHAQGLSPTIQFDRFEFEEDKFAPHRDYSHDPDEMAGDPAFLKRFLNHNLGQITERYKINPQIQPLPKNQKTAIFEVKKRDLPSDFGIYFFSGSAAQGYCLLEKVLIFQGNNAITQIKSLSTNPNYLKNQLQVPNNITYQVFEKTLSNGYIERYIIAQKAQQSVLLLDAFYPSSLEQTYQSYIVSYLNKAFARISYAL